MAIHFGTVRPGRTLYIPFDTFAGATGAPITMTNFAVGDILIYKDGSVTQRASTSGFTLLDTDGVDFDGITGIQGFSIDLADNTTAGFYTAGARYFVVVSTVTIDSQTMSFLAATFDIGYYEAILNTTLATLSSQTSFTLTTGPAEDNALLGCSCIIHDIASAIQIGIGLITGYTGSTKTVTLAAGVTFTAAAGDNISVFLPRLLPTVAARTLDVSSGGEAGVDWANVGTPSSTVSLSATTVATATNLTNAPTNGDLTATMKTSVNTEVVDALNTDTYAEPGQAAPAATASLVAKLGYLYKAWRNRTTQTSSQYSLYNDDAATVDQKATFSDNGTTADRGEVGTGP